MSALSTAAVLRRGSVVPRASHRSRLLLACTTAIACVVATALPATLRPVLAFPFLVLTAAFVLRPRAGPPWRLDARDPRAAQALVVGLGATVCASFTEYVSGGRGATVGVVVVFALAYLHARREALRWPAAFAIAPVAIFTAVVVDAGRLAALARAPTIARAGVASFGGWLLACVVAAAFASLAVATLVRRDGEARPSEAALPVFVAPLLFALGLELAAARVVTDLDTFAPIRFALVAPLATYALYRVRPELAPGLVPVAAGLLVFGAVFAFGARPDVDAVARARAELDALSSSARGWWIAAHLVGTVVIAPVVEELAFRGYLLRRGVSESFLYVSYRRCSPVAWILSALAFGAVHGSLVVGTLAGLVFAACAAYRGRLGDAIVAHAVTNAAVAGAVLFGDAWWLWV